VLGGIAERVWLEKYRKGQEKDTRSIVLGLLQRGGSPTTFDRLIALRFGAAAVRMIEEKRFGTMVALDPPEVKGIPLKR
jgi:6-phosphofructokinase 1